MQRILVIDDDYDLGQFVAEGAQAMGMECAATTSAGAFLDGLNPETTLIFLDLVMPEMDGIELLRVLSQKRCNAGIVLMSGADRRIIQTAEEWAEDLGLSIVGQLQKPFRLAELEVMLKRHLELGRRIVTEPAAHIFVGEADLRRAVERDEFVIHFQPQIEIKTGDVVGVEALVRWQHPDFGLVFPDDFIGMAERLGLIDDLGWIVMRRALADISRFSAKAGRNLSLAINFSSYSLQDARFPNELFALMAEYGIQPATIIIEVTETGLVQKLASSLDVFARLRMRGVQLSIDDFGTGYSMLKQLRLVPATELKIDRSFVQGMINDDHDRILVQKTIEIGHELGMRVVAEGVETNQQLAFLGSRKCEIAQGYFFSRPIPPDELMRWLGLDSTRREQEATAH
ncbi:EAL domain-containing response regulator [Granulicella sibirica]|uniref:Diguanylate cyclase/phosphodiesterase (GGDEF & EAL domains) with PAS/PAC sensor(S) n=1 Tax=Granulicella sibirica TaxID=2479048 RepID=A0A4Q0SVM1_9BACT|nr:EAL domain-containing response regulator [Granulicella sibirica]RXH55135.1 diguanylate cyclase/phosphodiesterase (GGDEF & EAL domains) with PAS/PAC sensor(s) [Granulicella sibirica]